MIALNDLTPKEAAQAVWEFEEVLTWIEWYFCGKNDKLADYINQSLRDEMMMIYEELTQEVQTDE